MPEAVADRIRRYILDGADDDPRRLLNISPAAWGMARAGFVRTGVVSAPAAGWWRRSRCAHRRGRTPDLGALGDYCALVHRLLERVGVAADTVEDLARSASTAGFEVVGVDGHFMTHDPALGLRKPVAE